MNRLATDPAYLTHAIAALEVVTRAEPLEHMDKFPCPKQVRPEPMSEQAAAWVREFAWTQKMRKTYKDVPAATHVCPCQSGPSGHCNAGRHAKCWHAGNEPFASPEAYVCRANGEVLVFAEPYANTTGSATRPKREQAAMVWLADRACRWRCPCDCHTGTPAAPEPPPAAPEPRVDKPVQLDLFASLTA